MNIKKITHSGLGLDSRFRRISSSSPPVALRRRAPCPLPHDSNEIPPPRLLRREPRVRRPASRAVLRELDGLSPAPVQVRAERAGHDPFSGLRRLRLRRHDDDSLQLHHARHRALRIHLRHLPDERAHELGHEPRARSRRRLAIRRRAATGSIAPLFMGKVPPSDEDPVSIFYSYLTNPRRYAPRWYHEGIAVFMETWMAGGIGRCLTGFDEMVFRTMVRDSSYFYENVGLQSEGTAIDFQVGQVAYLYGTRFDLYLAHKYGPDKLIDWVRREDGSCALFRLAVQEGLRRSARRGMGELDRLRARVAAGESRFDPPLPRHAVAPAVGPPARAPFRASSTTPRRRRSTPR